MIHNKNQPGSVASFIVVAIVLVVAALGAVWYLNNKDSVSINLPTGEVAKNDSDQAKDEKDKASQSSSDEQAKKEEAQSRAKQKIEAEKEQAEKDKSEKTDDQNTSDRNQAGSSSQSTSQNSGQAGSETDSPTSQADSMPNTGPLPETGPATDILASVIGLMAIVGSGYVYYHFGRK